MTNIKINTSTEEELIKLGIDFGKTLNERDVVFLEGELGAGKTTFVKGIAKALNIKKVVTSPTFLILKEYDNKLCHIDAYRITNEDIGIDDYIKNNYIVCIEWPKNLEDLIRPNYIVKIKYTVDGRQVEIEEYERSRNII